MQALQRRSVYGKNVGKPGPLFLIKHSQLSRDEMRIYLGSGVNKQHYMPDNSLLKGHWLGRVNTLRENYANGNEEGTCQFSGPAMRAMGGTLITAHKSTVEAQSS